MSKILVTGGTVFVSKYIAEYYLKKGEEVYVLNRNHHPQPEGAILIECDRMALGDKLKKYKFDVVLDVTAYTGENINRLLDALGEYKEYVMISSSAVYPETLAQPFTEEQPVGQNQYWGIYGTNKIEAEMALFKRVPDAYILRPPYLYGQMNNVYREAFVFDCAMQNRPFYLPKDGEMKLHFFHIDDLCKMIDSILDKKPEQHIFNVGNEQTISVKDWVTMCYQVVGKEPVFVPVYEECEQRNYFAFYDYEYQLDVTRQKQLLPQTKPMLEGLQEAYDWYEKHQELVNRKPYMEFIDEKLKQN